MDIPTTSANPTNDDTKVDNILPNIFYAVFHSDYVFYSLIWGSVIQFSANLFFQKVVLIFVLTLLGNYDYHL